MPSYTVCSRWNRPLTATGLTTFCFRTLAALCCLNSFALSFRRLPFHSSSFPDCRSTRTTPCDTLASRKIGYFVRRIALAIFQDAIIVNVSLRMIVIKPDIYSRLGSGNHDDIAVEIQEPTGKGMPTDCRLPRRGTIVMAHPSHHLFIVIARCPTLLISRGQHQRI